MLITKMSGRKRSGVLLFVVVAGATLAYYAIPRAAASASCGFTIGREAGELVPLGPETGEGIGMFERWPDGSVQLTTYGGLVPKVTDCLIRKGYRAELEKIKPYDGPALSHRRSPAPAVPEGDII